MNTAALAEGDFVIASWKPKDGARCKVRGVVRAIHGMMVHVMYYWEHCDGGFTTFGVKTIHRKAYEVVKVQPVANELTPEQQFDRRLREAKERTAKQASAQAVDS